MGQKALFAALSATTAIVSTVVPASAAYAQVAKLNIPAQDLGKSLREVARATQSNIVFDPAQTKGKKAPALSGEYSAESAVRALLSESGLQARNTGFGTWVITLGGRQGEAVAGNAAAQTGSVDTASSSGEEGVTENERGIAEILVVGSRSQNVDIRRSEDDPQPYQVIGGEEIARGGAVNLGDFLKKRLTSNATASTNTQDLESPVGTTSSINLRGLGANETLVLINGRRVAGVSLQTSGVVNQPDLNGIPLEAIERIEVLPLSASAIYGGTALGGVVNVILKKDYNGGAVKFSYGNTHDRHSPQYAIDGNIGLTLNEGTTHLMFGAQYFNEKPLRLKDRRDLIQRGITRVLNNNPAYLYGPFNPFSGGSTPNIAGIGGLVLDDGTVLPSSITSIPSGFGPGSSIATLNAGLLSNAGSYNTTLADSVGYFGLLHRFGSTQTVESGYASFRQDLPAGIKFFAEAMVADNKATSEQNPFTAPNVVFPSAPSNPFRGIVLVSFPSAQSWETRATSLTKTGSAGLIVPISNSWSVEADYTASRSKFRNHSVTRDAQSLSSAIATGQINPFVDTLAFPLDLSTYAVPVSYRGSSSIDDLGLRASGRLPALFGGRPALTIGVQQRREAFGDALYEETYQLRPTANVKTLYLGQSQKVSSAYAEMLLPLVRRSDNIPLISAFDIQLSVRGERYSVRTGPAWRQLTSNGPTPPTVIPNTTIFSAASPTVALKYSPIEAISMRGSYSRAFLPPSVRQLAVNPSLACGAPCTLISDPTLGISYQINYTTGGNPDLTPQKAISWSGGLIVEPDRGPLEGMRASLDYYHIRQPNYIASLTAQQLVNFPQFSQHVHRDPATGRITHVDIVPVNAKIYRTEGFDFKLSFRRETKHGRFGIDTAWTRILHDLRQFSVDTPFLDYAGYPGEGGAAKLKGYAALSYGLDAFDVSLTSNFVGKYKQVGTPGSPSFIQTGSGTPATIAQGGDTIPSQMYVDIYASYAFGLSRGKRDLQIEVSINNLLNKNPPYDAAAYPYFYSRYGDPRLRNFRVSLRKKF